MYVIITYRSSKLFQTTPKLMASSSSFISHSWREKCFPGDRRHFRAFLHEGLIKEGGISYDEGTESII